MSETFQEKRQFLRHPIHVPIHLRMEEHPSAIPTEVRDISLGGLSFLYKRKLRKGNYLEITIPVKEKMFTLNARVAYSREDRKSGRYKTGVTFADPNSAFRAKLAEESLEILAYRKKLAQEEGTPISEEEAAKRWIETFAKAFASISSA